MDKAKRHKDKIIIGALTLLFSGGGGTGGFYLAKKELQNRVTQNENSVIRMNIIQQMVVQELKDHKEQDARNTAFIMQAQKETNDNLRLLLAK